MSRYSQRVRLHCTGPNHHNHHGRRDNDYNHNKYYNEYHNKYYDYHHGCTG